MAKAETNEPSPVEQIAPQDRLSKLTSADVLNIVSKAAQHASRVATGNETRDAFIAFNRSLVEQLGGNASPTL